MDERVETTPFTFGQFIREMNSAWWWGVLTGAVCFAPVWISIGIWLSAQALRAHGVLL